MPVNKDSLQASWEADYRTKGRLYGGSARELPPFPSGTRVLDLGCGDGKSVVSMLDSGWHVTATDFSPAAVSLARDAAGRRGSAVFVVGDALLLPFRDTTFDAVTAIHLLGHCYSDTLRIVSREIDRVLRPGGSIYAVVFSQQDFRCGTGKETGPAMYVRGNGIMTRYFTEPEVSLVFPGYSIRSIERCEWMLRVRGREYLRSEIVALFSKPG
ncbi:class I SAM-dependent methyltransferase [Methanoregula formicica]|uniref:Methylase involved in ubiquinone/menaquinone biosynthesis n=1 Tax=Methanoregula formicica (strain DSM 22288 / NBRC 105244 / SMSP) TaxID=593750 RepID=L0HDF6_METFS|nr:class I SAM-dependent methyltransferase [Methanoregula formicica]AGB02742.1 methylase involved in ubiquinone/menaquinone biosynthesis [Methanoregula formicica SMSP]